MAEIMTGADEIVARHKNGEMSFHVAYDLLMETFDLEPDVALHLLHPPIGEGDWQIELEPKVIEAIYKEEE